MLYLISGATSSGKSTVSKAVAERTPNLVFFEEDERQPKTGEERMANHELWIADALALEARGTDVIFGSNSPLGEFLAAPGAVEIEGIAPCLLDAHDAVRLDRWVAQGVHPDWPIGMDHFCWAAFHRLHARDPQFEQRVLLERDYAAAQWSRWTGWEADDPRWTVFIHDSSREDFQATVAEVAAWVGRVREAGAPLLRSEEWWA